MFSGRVVGHAWSTNEDRWRTEASEEGEPDGHGVQLDAPARAGATVGGTGAGRRGRRAGAAVRYRPLAGAAAVPAHPVGHSGQPDPDLPAPVDSDAVGDAGVQSAPDRADNRITRRSWSCGCPYQPVVRFGANHTSRIVVITARRGFRPGSARGATAAWPRWRRRAGR